MDSVTLHFNVWQAGAHNRTTSTVEDPKGTTILALKKQLFPEAFEAGKTVRFIACGKVLTDSSSLDTCGLGNEAHIHVSVSEQSRSSITSTDSTDSVKSEAPPSPVSSTNEEGCASPISWAFIASTVLFIGTGIGLFVALKKRWQFTMHTSQLVFICAAVWVYLLVFHGLPSLFEVLSKLGSSSSSKDKSSRGTMGGASMQATAAEEATTMSPAPASTPGLSSLMTPTLPPGDAATSVLTQRR